LHQLKLKVILQSNTASVASSTQLENVVAVSTAACPAAQNNTTTSTQTQSCLESSK
jgi:hypothetical protein